METSRTASSAARLWPASLRLLALLVFGGFVLFTIVALPAEASGWGIERDSAAGGRLASAVMPGAFASIGACVLLATWLMLDVRRAISASVADSRLWRTWGTAAAVLAAVALGTLSFAVVLDSVIAGIGVRADQLEYWGSLGTHVGEVLAAACPPFVVLVAAALVITTLREQKLAVAR